jgi:bifunctional N-acetylglucosamine-1-phosphate-uridyltransferase/glucosamine-1-phosphate-acetyltransferase GlmU-like protein
MAGGLGKRMESTLPKVLHKVNVKNKVNISYPMIIHVIIKALTTNPRKIYIIVGKYKNIIKETIDEYINLKIITNPELIEYVLQEESLGTGHAIMCTLPYIKEFSSSKAIILSGDVPLISTETLVNLIDSNNQNKLLITKLDNPGGCGRIIMEDNKIINIIEEKDCNENEKNIKLVNCGIYQIKVLDLLNLIPQINNNNKANEYYLTDIVSLMINNNIILEYYNLPKKNQFEITNINTKDDLEKINHLLFSRKV